MNQNEFNTLRKIADAAYDYYSHDFTSDVHQLEDRRSESVNPFFYQTTQGFILEVYYGIPGSIHTPLGNYNCFGSGSGPDNGELDAYLNRIGAVLIKPKQINRMGEFGPWYAITSFDGIDLPMPEWKDKSEFMSYEESLNIWNELAGNKES